MLRPYVRKPSHARRLALTFAGAFVIAIACVLVAIPVWAEDFVEIEDGCTGDTIRVRATDVTPPRAASNATGNMEPGGPDQPPARWLEGATRCRRYRSRRYCDGPLRVPEPFGPEADLARRLGLGTHSAGGRALESTPPPAWMESVRTLTAPDHLKWPVDGGSVARGLQRGYRVRVRLPPKTPGGRPRYRTRTKPPHRGVDISARPGTHVFAIEEGLVVYAKNEMRGYGNVVLVLHSDESVSLYAHLRAAWVFAGQIVRRGQILGEVGETGLARGPHLHFEWRMHGLPQNPLPRFVERPARRSESHPSEAAPDAAHPAPSSPDEESEDDADFDL